jgi:hypothetical protein
MGALGYSSQCTREARPLEEPANRAGRIFYRGHYRKGTFRWGTSPSTSQSGTGGIPTRSYEAVACDRFCKPEALGDLHLLPVPLTQELHAVSHLCIWIKCLVSCHRLVCSFCRGQSRTVERQLQNVIPYLLGPALRANLKAAGELTSCKLRL